MQSPKLVTPIYWKIIINRDNDDGIATMEYEDHYDKNIEEHVEAYNNMKTYRSGFEDMLGACLDFSEEKEKLIVKYVLKAPFTKIANAISMEFLGLGTLGKATLLDIIGTMGASIIKAEAVHKPEDQYKSEGINRLDEEKTDKMCTDNYIR